MIYFHYFPWLFSTISTIFNPRGETLKVGLQTAVSTCFTGPENQILKTVAMKNNMHYPKQNTANATRVTEKDAVQKWNGKNSNSKPRVWNDLTSTELDVFIGILLAMGLPHNNMQDSKVLWRSNALPIFRAAMSHRRFLALSRYIRFDDSRTREFRQRSDKAAPIRDIWNFLNASFAKNYEPHENITVPISWQNKIYLIYTIKSSQIWNESLVGM